MTSAVVVGSGPNGLAAALTLAAEGVSVRVLEANDTLGGGLRSGEVTLPGVIHDECSAIHPLVVGSPFARRFDLEGAGLTWRWAPAELAHPLEGERGATLLRSVEDTAIGLGDDARAWATTFGPLAKHFDAIVPEFLQPVPHLPRKPLQFGLFGAYAAMPNAVVGQRFRTPEARGLFGGTAAHGFRPFNRPLSAAIGVALTTAAHAYGWPVAEGGTAAIADAIMVRAREHGVQFETGRRVTSLDELRAADLVLLDTSPRAAAAIIGDRLSERARKAYTRFRPAPGVFKVDYAIEGEVPWTYAGARSAGTVHLGGRFEEIAAAERAMCAGKMPEQPFVLIGQQHLADPTRSAGNVHPLYAYAHVPAGYPHDASAAITARIEQFAPGFRDRILATHISSPADLERGNANLIGGDVIGGAATVPQLVFRPRVGLNPYATGVSGVYLCSASTPPGAGAHGMGGYNAATRALADLRR
jgi:phytoene dehydrogenase-like protein